METKYLTISEKIRIMTALEKGDKSAIRAVMDEIQRLESIIKDYEVGIRVINEKFNSKIFKTPSTKI